MNKKTFKFHPLNAKPSESQSQSFLAHIPKGISDKKVLLRLLAKVLTFPNYFGLNWDALDECLADLSWLKETGKTTVCIWHEDLPLASNPDEARKYLKVLNGVLCEPGCLTLEICFPETTRKSIQALLLSHTGDSEGLR